MSLYDYDASKEISDYPFYSLLMALMRKADDDNLMLLQLAFPSEWDELQQRYNAPGGMLASDTNDDVAITIVDDLSEGG